MNDHEGQDACINGARAHAVVRDTAQMMIAGPALVDWASLGDVSKEELGHARIHTRNGAIDDEVSSEAEAFEARLDHALRAWAVDDRWLRRSLGKKHAIFARDGWRCTVQRRAGERRSRGLAVGPKHVVHGFL